MELPTLIKAVKGTRDLLPPSTEVWNDVEGTARAVLRAYNHHEIRTPILEETQLFARGVGADTSSGCAKPLRTRPRACAAIASAAPRPILCACSTAKWKPISPSSTRCLPLPTTSATRAARTSTP